MTETIERRMASFLVGFYEGLTVSKPAARVRLISEVENHMRAAMKEKR